MGTVETGTYNFFIAQIKYLKKFNVSESICTQCYVHITEVRYINRKLRLSVYCNNEQWNLLLLNTPNLSTDLQAFVLHNWLWNFVRVLEMKNGYTNGEN
jgi:hypothetical protein